MKTWGGQNLQKKSTDHNRRERERFTARTPKLASNCLAENCNVPLALRYPINLEFVKKSMTHPPFSEPLPYRPEPSWKVSIPVVQGKWGQVGTKIRARIDVSTKAEKSTKRYPTNAKWGSEGSSWEPKAITNRLKNEVKMRRHLSIDYWTMFVDFGKQVGKENRTKSEQQIIQKGIEKMITTKKTCVLEAAGGVRCCTLHRSAGILRPPNWQGSKKT